MYEGCDEGKTTYIFEKGKNRISKAVNESLSGSYQGKTVYKYDEAGSLNEEVYYGCDDSIDCVYNYDKYGNTIAIISYSNNKPVHKTEYVYTKEESFRSAQYILMNWLRRMELYLQCIISIFFFIYLL